MSAQATEAWFSDELERLHRRYRQGDYAALMEALRLCIWNRRSFPDWLGDVVLKQADEEFLRGSTGRGKHGNWRKQLTAKQIDETRADLAEFHLRARTRRGRLFVSNLGTIFGYGKPAPGGGPHIVTRADVFRFIAKQLKGTPAEGTALAMKRSHAKKL